jgi:hypothetical protein
MVMKTKAGTPRVRRLKPGGWATVGIGEDSWDIFSLRGNSYGDDAAVSVDRLCMGFPEK